MKEKVAQARYGSLARLLSAAALLLRWSRGWVEPVTAPPEPRHIVALQIIVLCLQEHHVGDRLWPEWWNGFGPFSGAAAEPIVKHLVSEGYLDQDSGMLFIGPEAERHFGDLLTENIEGPRKLLLAGRSW